MQTDSAYVPQRYVYASVLIGITMMAAVLWMPSMLGALARGYGFDTGSLSRLASAELIGFLSGTLFTSFRSLAALKRWLFIGCLLLASANLMSRGTTGLVLLAALRLIAGFGAGIGFGYGLKVCALSARPTRSFGIFTGSMSMMMIVGFQVIAHLIDSRSAAAGGVGAELFQGVARTVFGLYACLAVGAATVFLANRPPGVPVDQAVDNSPLRLPGPLVLIGLAAIALSFVGQGSVWAFLQILGISHGFSVSGVANAMSAFAIMGVFGSLGAAITPRRIPRWLAMGAALLLLVAGLYALYSPRSLEWYVAGCAIGGFYWNFILPLMLGLLARIDETGGASVLGGTMSSVGSALGPLLAAQLIRGTDYQAVGWMAGGLCALSLGCIWYVERSRPPHSLTVGGPTPVAHS
jgi:predicted MFS family arabinose efflux permease